MNDIPPYVIYVYVYSDKSTPLHFSILSRVVSESIKSDVLLIKWLGAGKAIIEVKSADTANRVISNSVFEKNSLRAFIPSFKILRTGIIKGIDQSISLDCLRENLTSTVKVLEVHLNRRMIINGKATYVPSRTICIKFAGQSLPKEVVLFSALYKVDAYIPKARICYVGYRIGHIGRNCKSTKPKCLFCGLTKEEDHSCSIDQLHAKCINCEGEHLATSHTCPIIIKHKTILGLAAQDNIPLVEAKKIVASNSSPSLPSHNTLRYFKNFPYLPNHTSYSAPKSYSFPHATPRPPSMTPLVSYNHFQYLDHDDSNDPFSPNPPISYAKLAASSSRRHDQPTVSGSSSGKPSILKIKSVTGKYNILSAPSPNHPTQRTNKSGYSQEHLDLLLVSNGRIDTNYDAKQYHAIKGARDKNPPCPPSRENSTSNAGTIIQKMISFLENCESLVNIPAITSMISPSFLYSEKFLKFYPFLVFASNLVLTL